MSCGGPIDLFVMSAGDDQHVSNGAYFCDGYQYDNSYTCYMQSVYQATQGSESNSTWQQVGEEDCPGQARYSRQDRWVTLGYGSQTRNGGYRSVILLERVVSPDGFIVTKGENQISAGAVANKQQILYPDNYYSCSLGSEKVDENYGYQLTSSTDSCGQTNTSFKYSASLNRQVNGADGSTLTETLNGCTDRYSEEGQYIESVANYVYSYSSPYGESYINRGLIPCGIPICHFSTPGCIVGETLGDAQTVSRIKKLLNAALETRLFKMQNNSARTCPYHMRYMCSDNENPNACWGYSNINHPFLYTVPPSSFEDQYAVNNTLIKLRLGIKNKHLGTDSGGARRATNGIVRVYVPNSIGYDPFTNYPIWSSASPCCCSPSASCSNEYSIIFQGGFAFSQTSTDPNPEDYIYSDLSNVINLREISELYPPIVVDEYPHGYPLKVCVEITN